MNTVFECPTIRFSRLENDTFELKSTSCFADNKIIIMGNAAPNNTGHFNVTSPILSDKKIPMRLLATDYTSYSVIVSCDGNNLGK